MFWPLRLRGGPKISGRTDQQEVFNKSPNSLNYFHIRADLETQLLLLILDTALLTSLYYHSFLL